MKLSGVDRRPTSAVQQSRIIFKPCRILFTQIPPAARIRSPSAGLQHSRWALLLLSAGFLFIELFERKADFLGLAFGNETKTFSERTEA